MKESIYLTQTNFLNENKKEENDYTREIGYSSYMISSKIPEHTEEYQEDEMIKEELKIKEYTIHRVLTKWAEEL